MRVYLSGPQGSWRSEMEGHDSAFYRRLGIQAIENIPRCRDERKTTNLFAAPVVEEQLGIFDQEIGA